MTIDIDADAAKILTCATRAVKVILDRRAALDRAGKQDQALLVVTGEGHDRPGHSWHHLLVIDGVRRALSGPGPVVGLEYPHNRLEEYFSQAAGGSKPDVATAVALRALDRTGALSLTADMGFKIYRAADHSGKTFKNFLRRHNIATCFSEAANNKDVLTMDDPSTAASMTACLGNVSPEISIFSAEGMHVRNHHMLNTLLPFAREHGARIAFQICGNAHVAGYAIRNMGNTIISDPTRFSLTGLAKKGGIPVLAIPLFAPDWDERRIPADHGLLPEEMLFVNGLPSPSARYPLTDPSRKKSDMPSRAAEAAYLEGLFRHAGRADDILTVDQHVALQLQCRKEIRALPAQLARGGPS